MWCDECITFYCRFMTLWIGVLALCVSFLLLKCSMCLFYTKEESKTIAFSMLRCIHTNGSVCKFVAEERDCAHNLLLFNLIRTLFIIMIISILFLHASKTESEKTKGVWCVRVYVYVLCMTHMKLWLILIVQRKSCRCFFFASNFQR